VSQKRWGNYYYYYYILLLYVGRIVQAELAWGIMFEEEMSGPGLE